jgi:hypothetical protein
MLLLLSSGRNTFNLHILIETNQVNYFTIILLFVDGLQKKWQQMVAKVMIAGPKKETYVYNTAPAISFACMRAMIEAAATSLYAGATRTAPTTPFCHMLFNACSI